MSKQDVSLVRISTKAKDRLNAVAKRDRFSLVQALETVVNSALPDLESGKRKFGASLTEASTDSK